MFSFRKNWALDDYGKWAEHSYTGLTYPWFACGSGSIFSSDVAEWLSDNGDRLLRFQVSWGLHLRLTTNCMGCWDVLVMKAVAE